MDSRFYDSKANFKCYHNQGDSHIVFAVGMFITKTRNLPPLFVKKNKKRQMYI